MTPEIIQLLVAALSGGGVGAFAVKLLERKDRREEGEIDRLRKDVDETRQASKDCEARYDQLEADHRLLSDRLRAVEASTPSYLARWVKDQHKRILWLNDRAYMTMFAPLGWSRAEVLDKTFAELLGDGSTGAMMLLDDLDRQALKHPGEVQSLLIQLHPDLPNMVVVKVAFANHADGLLRYEGSSFVPNSFAEDMGSIRQARAKEAAARSLFSEDGRQ